MKLFSFFFYYKNKGGVLLMARPRKVINQKQFESLCAIQCTEEEICNVLDVSEKTLISWCNEVYGESFSKVFRQKRDLGKTNIRRNK